MRQASLHAITFKVSLAHEVGSEHSIVLNFHARCCIYMESCSTLLLLLNEDLWETV